MIIKCPVVYKNENKLDKYSEFDINFWNPCHRILHTPDSMRMVIEEAGGVIQDYGLNPYMGFNLMSVMIKNGVKKIQDIRNPFYMIPELESEWKFNLFLFKSFFYRTCCADSIFIIRKV